MSTSDKNERRVAIYFDTVEEKQKFERDAARFGLSMNKLGLMIIRTGAPIVLRSLRQAKKQQNEVIEQIAKTP